ncbi:MAG: NitT/TauT family transport system permease protein [Clostridiales bacterium]|jgi:ABC-type nitrate/sulfonate/bicarbonate transport system permease component|nr:NitT/TauT family transport system permease protein [Clostridiales bacterium]MDN5282830.1 NitT/TauT family transport system permease protein [Candidatus Ozemobacter sp.]
MFNDLVKNFFGIRIAVKTHEKVFLGAIPIVLIFLLWVITTTGRNETIILPEGTFEGYEEAPPSVGTRFSEDVRYTIEDATLEYPENDGNPETWLIKGDQRVKITLPSRALSNSVRLTLPKGKLVKRNLADSMTLSDQPAQQQSIASATASDPIDLAATGEVAHTDSNFSGTISYKFENVQSRIFSPVILPSPWEVFSSLPSLWSERSLLTNMLYSFLRVGAGFLAAFIIVFPISLLMGTFSKFNSIFAPLMLFGGYLPIPALVPLTMSLFGTNEEQKIMFLALGFAIYLMPLFVKALDEVDNVYLQTGYTLGAGKFQILNKILLPIAMPKIYDAMRLGFGIGWGYIILAEMVDMGSKGVGTLILTSQRRGPREDIYLVLIAIVIMAFITDKIWEKVGHKLFPYRSQER